MKLLSSTALALGGVLALLLVGLAAADTCPTLRVTAKAPKIAHNNKLHTVTVRVKNTASTAANNVQIAMTLPANVLYKSHTSRPLKNGAPTFAQAGQVLTWSSINLARRGAAHMIKLKVNVTNCADGQLAFTPATTVGGACPTTATPATATVKHPKGWTACAVPPVPPPVTAECGIPTGTLNVYACPPNKGVCGEYAGDVSGGPFSTPQACAQAAVSYSFIWVKWDKFDQRCFGYNADGVRGYIEGADPGFEYQTYSMGQPRDLPPTRNCDDRRLLEEE